MSTTSVDDAPQFTSALARELAAVPASVRRRFGVPDIAIDVLEALVVTLREMLDDSDGRPLEERLSAAGERFEPIFSNLDPAKLERITQWVESDFKSELERRLAQFRSPAGRLFLNRLLGSARFERLKRALVEDGALLLLAVRRMLRFCLPLAQAIQDAASTVPASVRDDFAALNFTEFTLVHLSVQLDSALDRLLEKQGLNLDELNLPYRAGENTVLGVEIDELVRTLRAALSEETLQRADDISDRLGRKLRGFEQALELSEDGASQAATSLVEFIDRLLRGAFDDDYVLDWAKQHFPQDATLAYTPNGSTKTRPTKKAQALCFAYAGQPPSENSTLEQLMAVSIVQVRNLAEKIKHADEGTVEEKEVLRDLMASLRGSITFTMRFTWPLAGDDRIDYLRERFGKAA